MQKSPILPDEDGLTIAAVVRRRLNVPWSRARALCERGKVALEGEHATDPAARVKGGQELVIDERLRPPKPRTAARIVFEDEHVLVIDKPSGVSSVPFDERDTGTAMDAVREAWRYEKRRARPLYVAHRIDKETSGLLAFALSRRAEKGLKALFHDHDLERTYICAAHGSVDDQKIESMLVKDRGDGLRGSTDRPRMGKRAVTHVCVLECMPLATLCEVRLETGRTHQIRIHLSEAGHPIVGERVYIRDYKGTLIQSPRLLLHAATLGFVHPITRAPVRLFSPLPKDFEAELARCRAATSPG